MTDSIYSYPGDVLIPRKVIAEIVPATVSGGRSLTSVEKIVAPDAGYWQIDLMEIPIASVAQKRAARAMSASLGGRLGLIDVPVYVDSSTAPTVPIGGTITCAQLANQGDVRVHMTASSGIEMLEAGMDFSRISNADLRNHLYRITQIVYETVNGDGSITYEVAVTPPLRQQIAATLRLQFVAPLLTCRAADDQQMRSIEDDYAGRTLANFSFVEALEAN